MVFTIYPLIGYINSMEALIIMSLGFLKAKVWKGSPKLSYMHLYLPP
jgi:hypothetical protein